jgi:sortase A
MEEYNSLLDLSGTGIIGYITIKSIGVYIPIYHGTDESVLQIAVGHLEWTSLPVGGESTHSVLSGHRGLPSAKLFTDLDQLREGDTFTVTVLNQMITYEIDQIRIVEPGDISELSIVPGKDYCTLVTCTPYGINTHRMLVRGTRTANETGELVVPAEAFRIPNYITIPAVGIPLLFLTLLTLLIVSAVRRPQLKRDDIYRLIENETESRPASAPRDGGTETKTRTKKRYPEEEPKRETATKPKSRAQAEPGEEKTPERDTIPDEEEIPEDDFPEDDDWFPEDDPED